MMLEAVRRILQEDAPLTVHLVSGRSFDVRHTDYAALSMSDPSLILTDDNDQIEVIRLPSIESITLDEKPAAQPGAVRTEGCGRGRDRCA